IARRMVWRGWATRTEVPRILAQILLEGTLERELQIEDIRTVRDLMEVWLGEVIMPRVELKPASKLSTRNAARRVTRGLGDHRLDRLSRLAIDQWLAVRQREGDSATTIKLDLVMLRVAWRWGQQVGACPPRELALPKVRAVPKNEKRTPTPGEVARVVEWLETKAKPWVSLVVKLQAGLGCRIGELADLTWDRVDLEQGTVTLEGKTGRRTVPLTGALAQALADAPRTAERISGRAHKTVVFTTNQKLADACDALEIERFTTHGLRRLAVDTLARSGVDVGTAAAMLGHSPAVMLQAYRQVTLEDLGAAARALSATTPRGQVVAFPSGHNLRSQLGEDAD
ncbi:MAG: site-specific integrase, partial [Myxococcota bacterium]